MANKNYLSYFLSIILFCSCTKPITVFEQQPATTTGISFINKNEDTDSLNIFDYLYYYNGAGVAAGDINNDGLQDIYFVANQGANKLYLNKGGFKFEDITASAGVKGATGWNTGVTMADVNGDGWLDIYVCTVASHTPQNYSGGVSGKDFFPDSKNELFINNKNGTFTESAAKYGIDIAGYSTQAAFFDYDKDGDLDMFLIQHSTHQTDSYGDTSLRSKYSPVSGCKLFRNENGNYFTNVTKQSNLISSALSYCLGIAVADFNNDGWDDVYVSNDFHENDYYYLNNGNGTFSEQIKNAFGHTSNFSMGSDAADFNNDGRIDVMTLDMLPEDETVLKSSLTDESFDQYAYLHNQGYHYQYSKNCLQLNMDAGKHFAETSLYSGVAATDWSWAVLGADFNMDGNKDIFITNGIKRRLNDLDFLRFWSAEAFKYNGGNERDNDKNLLSHLPGAAWHNYMFLNSGDANFTDASAAYGFDKPSLSNGCAYVDLDNDGDLDIVINNLNEPCSILKNNTANNSNKNYLTLKFTGINKNKFGVGVKVLAFTKNKMQLQQVQPTRGFMSSVPPLINMAFDTTSIIDSVIIIWPANTIQKFFNLKTNQQITVQEINATDSILDCSTYIFNLFSKKNIAAFEDISSQINLQWKHMENLSFNDFSINPFVPHQLSAFGPALAVKDINGDGLDDIFAGGAKNQPGAVFMQKKDGSFSQSIQTDITSDSSYEDNKAIFFDADGDGDNDLYVAGGGGEFFGNEPLLQDRVYLNDGKGSFKKLKSFPALYQNKTAVAIADFDKDGDMDIFTGGRGNAKNYGVLPNSFLLQNDGKGNFKEITNLVPGLANAGMITDAAWQDLDGDSYPELIIAGEWMQPLIYKNKNGKLILANIENLHQLTGMWQSIFIADVNNDKQPDIFLGNYGLNSKLKATEKYPLKLFCKDIANDGNVDQILAVEKNGSYYTFLGKEALEKQLPFLKKEYLSYDKMAGKTVTEIFGDKLNNSTIFEAANLASMVLINKGNINFKAEKLPSAFQWMPLFSFAQLPDATVIAGGNFYGVLPYEGRYDNGLLPIMRFEKNQSVFANYGFAEGEVRSMQWLNLASGKKVLVIARNNLPLLFLYPVLPKTQK